MAQSRDDRANTHEKFKAAVERSSFGTPKARAVRRYTDDVTAAHIVKRSQVLGKKTRSREG